MLKLSELARTGDKWADEYLARFASERLRELCEFRMRTEAKAMEVVKTAAGGEMDEEKAEAILDGSPLEGLVDLDELAGDPVFANLVSIRYLPPGFPEDRANREFIGLYRMLASEKEYEPDMTKGYMMAALVEEEGLAAEVKGGDRTTVARIPEPERGRIISLVARLAKVEIMASRRLAAEGFSPADYAEKYVEMFEDLEYYPGFLLNGCGWEMLVGKDWEWVEKFAKGAAETVGRYGKTHSFGIRSGGKRRSVTFEIDVAPWDMERHAASGRKEEAYGG